MGILVPAKPGPPSASPGSEQRLCRPRWRWRGCRSPYCRLPSKRRCRGRPCPPAFVFAGSGAGPAVRPAGGPAWGWGTEGTGRSAPFFTVPAILRTRSDHGGAVASTAALGARVVAENRWVSLARVPFPGTAVGAWGQSSHIQLQGLDPRARVNLSNRPEAQKIRRDKGWELTFTLNA